MLSALFTDAGVESNQFLQWMLPRVNYNQLSNRLKYHQPDISSRVILFEYYYPSPSIISKHSNSVDMIRCGATIHELLKENSGVKNVMDKLFCSSPGMYWYTRRKIIYTPGEKPYESNTIRQVVLVLNDIVLDNLSEINNGQLHPPL